MDLEETLERIDALAQLGLRLALSAASGRVLLSKVADAMDPAWMPKPWDKTIWPALAEAQTAAREPLAFNVIEETLRKAWRAKVAKVLDELEREPVAVTATSQVHRGELDGKPVAVKVLRPGLAAAVRQDLVLLDGLLAPLAGAFPGIDPQALVAEARERMMDELDLENEAANQRRFKRALRNHPEFVVPAPFTELSHDSVLVSEWIDGVPAARGVEDPDRFAARLLEFVFGGLRFGLVHADADLDDLLQTPDGKLAILDYGAVSSVVGSRVDSSAAVVAAFRAGDGKALGRALASLGMLDAELGERALAVGKDVLGPLGEDQETRLDVEAVSAILHRLDQKPEAAALILGGGLEPPDLWPGRALAQMFSVIARVGASASWPAAVTDALNNGWKV